MLNLYKAYTIRTITLSVNGEKVKVDRKIYFSTSRIKSNFNCVLKKGRFVQDVSNWKLRLKPDNNMLNCFNMPSLNTLTPSNF